LIERTFSDPLSQIEKVFKSQAVLELSKGKLTAKKKALIMFGYLSGRSAVADEPEARTNKLFNLALLRRWF
jgi:hypothetical protein